MRRPLNTSFINFMNGGSDVEGLLVSLIRRQSFGATPIHVRKTPFLSRDDTKKLHFCSFLENDMDLDH